MVRRLSKPFRGPAKQEPVVQKPKTLAASTRMYQKTLFKQNAKNVYEHLHKDSAQREINKKERQQASINRITSLSKNKGK
jgi:hypothetical protein